MEKDKGQIIDRPVNPFFIFIALPIALFVTVLSYICVLFGCNMKKTIKEVNKVLVLILIIGIGSYIIGSYKLTPGSAAAKAREIQAQGLNLTDNLTREERDQYMLYLRELNDYDYENPKADSIYKSNRPSL